MKKINYIIISALFAILPYTSRLKAQTIAVKSDLLTGALSSPNLSAEVKLSERFTLEAGLHYNPFSIGKDKYLKHWFVQPELRYWMYQPYKRSFLGINLMYGVYNISKIKLPFGIFKGMRSSRYEGDFVGIGMAIILSCLPIGEWKQASEWDFFTPDMSVTIVRVAEKRQEQAIETSLHLPKRQSPWYI